MIDLSEIILKIRELLALVHSKGAFDGGPECATWTFGNFSVLEHNCLGTALYIGEVQVWNNW